MITNLWMDLFQVLLGTLSSVETGLQKLHTPRELFGNGIRLLNTFSQVCYLGQPKVTYCKKEEFETIHMLLFTSYARV